MYRSDSLTRHLKTHAKEQQIQTIKEQYYCYYSSLKPVPKYNLLIDKDKKRPKGAGMDLCTLFKIALNLPRAFSNIL